MHRAAWPTVAEVRAAGAGRPAAVLPLAAAVLAEVRKAKSTAKMSMQAAVERVEVVRDAAAVALLEDGRTDLCNAGVVDELVLTAGDAPRVEVALAPAPAP